MSRASKKSEELGKFPKEPEEFSEKLEKSPEKPGEFTGERGREIPKERGEIPALLDPLRIVPKRQR